MNGFNGRHGSRHAPGPVKEDRDPPQNLEAEQGVLGSALLDPGLLPRLRAILSRADFYRDAYAVLWDALCRMADGGVPIDCLTLVDWLSREGTFDRVGGDETLDALMAIPSAANGAYYAGIVRDHACKRRVIEVASGLLAEGYDSRHSGAELAQIAQSRVERLAEGPFRAFRAGLQEISDEPVVPRTWPAPPEPAAFRGLLGEYAEAMREHSEADPIGVLIQSLVGFGNLIGRWAYWRVNATRHYLNLNAVTVGLTSVGRKGTAWDEARTLLAGCDPTWAQFRIQGGLSSGEGLVWAVRDPITKVEAIREKHCITGYRDVLVDRGVDDKRLLVVETELARTFKVMTRENNTLSTLIREAFDHGDLRILTKQPIAATAAHISIIGHITEIEAARYLNQNEAANGFGNRFLWACVRMGKLLPRGGALPESDLEDFRIRLRAAHERACRFWADGPYEIPLAPDAIELWDDFYARVHRPRFSVLGDLLARAAAITRRLAAIYSLVSGEGSIHRSYLESAMALWEYAERSAAYIFVETLGDPDSDRILDAIRSAGEGLSQEDLHSKVFSGHRPRKVVAGLLARLLESGLIRSDKVATGGRPRTLWFPTSKIPDFPGSCAESAERG